MKRERNEADLGQIGVHLETARIQQGLTQEDLARRSGIHRTRISRIERGEYLPTLPQLLRLAKGLAVSIQWFFTGWNAPDITIASLAVELQCLGIADLHVPDARVPGSFRPAEQVVALSLRGSQPEPRIIEAIPAVLAWNSFYLPLLIAYSERHDPRANRRLGWLADLTLTIHRAQQFPGGCRDVYVLERLVAECEKRLPASTDDMDDLGRPALHEDLIPVWRRWRITYAADLATFVERARHLNELREQRSFAARYLEGGQS